MQETEDITVTFGVEPLLLNVQSSAVHLHPDFRTLRGTCHLKISCCLQASRLSTETSEDSGCEDPTLPHNIKNMRRERGCRTPRSGRSFHFCDAWCINAQNVCSSLCGKPVSLCSSPCRNWSQSFEQERCSVMDSSPRPQCSDMLNDTLFLAVDPPPQDCYG